MSTEAKLHLFDDIDWVDEMADPTAPLSVIESGQRAGAKRKRVIEGDGGFHLQFSTMPAGFHVAPHSHDHDELFIVLSGGCTMWASGPDEGVEMGPNDSATLAAGHDYAFTCGADGMTFYVVRNGRAGVTKMAAAD